MNERIVLSIDSSFETSGVIQKALSDDMTLLEVNDPLYGLSVLQEKKIPCVILNSHGDSPFIIDFMRGVNQSGSPCDVVTCNTSTLPLHKEEALSAGVIRHFSLPLSSDMLLATVDTSIRLIKSISLLTDRLQKKMIDTHYTSLKITILLELMFKRWQEGRCLEIQDIETLLWHAHRSKENSPEKSVLILSNEKEPQWGDVIQNKYKPLSITINKHLEKDIFQLQTLDLTLFNTRTLQKEHAESMMKIKMAYPRSRLLVLTAPSSFPFLRELFRKGIVDAVLITPFHIQELLSIIGRLFQTQAIDQLLFPKALEMISHQTITHDHPTRVFKEWVSIRKKHNQKISIQEVCAFFPQLEKSRESESSYLPMDINMDMDTLISCIKIKS